MRPNSHTPRSVMAWLVVAIALVSAGCGGGDSDAPALAAPPPLPPAETRVLFIRGGDGTGGFLEATDAAGRTEHLGDINNASTTAGNHGWSELAQALRADGFVVEQRTEGVNVPVALTAAALAGVRVVVFGSNNASYTAEHVDAVVQFVTSGGGVLFISDANFGENWSDAPNSDQPFLDRFGLVMNQDSATTYAVSRAGSDFLVPGHPTLAGIESFDGEGVSACTIAGPVNGVSAQVIVRAKGSKRLNDSPAGGALTAVGAADGALIVATAGSGRVACHFDRNTFFNTGGAGSGINRLNNRAYALSLFRWLAARP